ncbi:hypothetical protein LTR94_036504, partial [Friedmanniomyces endolithicus]
PWRLPGSLEDGARNARGVRADRAGRRLFLRGHGLVRRCAEQGRCNGDPCLFGRAGEEGRRRRQDHAL